MPYERGPGGRITGYEPADEQSADESDPPTAPSETSPTDPGRSDEDGPESTPNSIDDSPSESAENTSSGPGSTGNRNGSTNQPGEPQDAFSQNTSPTFTSGTADRRQQQESRVASGQEPTTDPTAFDSSPTFTGGTAEERAVEEEAAMETEQESDLARLARRKVRTQARENVQEQYPSLDAGEDFTIDTTEREGGRVVARADLTDDGQRELARRSEDPFTGATAATEDFLSGIAQAGANTRAAVTGNEAADVSIDFRGEGSVANVAATEAQDTTGERFGDINWTNLFREGEMKESDPFEENVDDAAGWFSENVAKPTGEIAGDLGQAIAESSRTARFGSPLAAGGRVAERPNPEKQKEAVEDVFSGPAAEAEPTRAENFSEGVGRGAAELVNLPGYASTGMEATEFGVAGAKAVSEGEGAEFAKKTGGTGALAASQAAKAFDENPAQTSGMVVGGLVGSASLIRGAGRIGPRAQRATSAVIQPGEEAAIAAARSGAISSRTARLVPGVRRRHIGDSDDSSVDLLDAGISERLPSVDRPSVRVDVDPDAGRLEIDPDLRRQLRDRTIGRVGDAAGRAREFPGQVRAGARARGERVWTGFRSARDRVDAITDMDFDDFAPSVGRPGLDAAWGLQRPDVSIYRPSFSRPTAPEFGDLSARARGAAGRASRTLDDVMFRSASIGPDVSGDVALQQAFTRGSRLPFPSRPDTGLDDVSGFSSSVAGRAGAAVDDFTFRTASIGPDVSGDVALQQAFTRGSSLPGSDRDGFDVELPDVRGAARREATSLRFEAAERAARTREQLSDLSDFTIRVGDVDRDTVFDTGDVDEPPIRSQTDDPLDIGPDREGDLEGGSAPGTSSGSAGGAQLAPAGRGSGVAVQRVVDRPRMESDSRTDIEPETSRGFGLEAEVPIFEESFDTGFGDSLGTSSVETSAVGSRFDPFEGEDTGISSETDLGRETEIDVGGDLGFTSEFEQEQRQDPFLDTPREFGREPDRDRWFEDDEDDSSFGGGFSISSEEFDTGVAQSLDDLGIDDDGSDPWDSSGF